MRIFACLLAVALLLLFALPISAEPSPPEGYYCTFYGATCDVGTGSCCACYDGFGDHIDRYNVAISVGDLLYFSDDAYDIPEGSCGDNPEIVPEIYIEGWFELAQNEIYTVTSPIPEHDPYVDFQTCSYGGGSPGIYHCTDSPPTPTPTPTSTPVPTPTPVSGQQVEINWLDPNCETAEVSCSSSGDPWVYANGLKLGRCSSMPATFASRQTMTDTVVLADTATFTASAGIECVDTWGQTSPITPTMPTLPTPPEPSTDTLGALGSPGGVSIPMPDFGGDLGDPGSPINRWLGYATSTINSVNTGNLLYIVGAVASAGMVLSWAIRRVRNPKGL